MTTVFSDRRKLKESCLLQAMSSYDRLLNLSDNQSDAKFLLVLWMCKMIDNENANNNNNNNDTVVNFDYQFLEKNLTSVCSKFRYQRDRTPYKNFTTFVDELLDADEDTFVGKAIP